MFFKFFRKKKRPHNDKSERNISVMPGYQEPKNVHALLFVSMIMKKYDDEKYKKIADDIWNYVQKKYPDVEIEYTNYRNDNYKASFGKFVTSLPCYDAGELDLECVIKVIREMQSKKGKLKKKYFAYIFKIMKEGWIGKGFENNTVIDLVTLFQNEFPDLKDKNLYTYLPKGKGKIPFWTGFGPDNVNNVKLTKDAIEFAKEFIESYWALKRPQGMVTDSAQK